MPIRDVQALYSVRWTACRWRPCSRLIYTEDPTTWGYTVDSAASEPVFEPIPDKSPFKLQLMGQLVPNQPLAIPDSLKNVVSIHSKLDYPDYYRLLSNAVSTLIW